MLKHNDIDMHHTGRLQKHSIEYRRSSIYISFTGTNKINPLQLVLLGKSFHDILIISYNFKNTEIDVNH